MPISHTRDLTRPLKTSETLARKLVEMLLAEGLSRGESLPTEASMLEEYSVSRESLREGLRLLEVQGLLTIRRGPSGGPSVGAVDPANLGRISSLYYRLVGATYRELHEAWVHSEATLAERAARNPDAEARAAAMAPYLDHSPDPESDLTDYLLAQTGFHAAIASLARNRVLELSLQAVGSIVSHHFFVEEDPRKLGAMIHDDHARIARAIAAGRAKAARERMEAHIENVARTSEIFVERFDEHVDWI